MPPLVNRKRRPIQQPSAALSAPKQQPSRRKRKSTIAATGSSGKSGGDEEDICPVCDHDCTCGQGGGPSPVANASGAAGARGGKNIATLRASKAIERRSQTGSRYPAVSGSHKRVLTDSSSYSSSAPSDGESIPYADVAGAECYVASGSSSSEFDSTSSGEDQPLNDSEFLAIEEGHIRKYGLNSDEELNEEPLSIDLTSSDCSSSDNESATGGDGDTIGDCRLPLHDPNEIDHVWSTEDDHNHVADFSDHDSSSLTSVSSEMIENESLLVTGVGVGFTADGVSSRRSRLDCKKRGSDASLDTASVADFVPQMSPSSFTANLSPELIQTYLASRGINITSERAAQFAESMSNGTFLSPQISSNKLPSTLPSSTKAPKSSHSIRTSYSSSKKLDDSKKDFSSGVYTSRYAGADEALMTKEAKQMEALQAQAYGGMGGYKKSDVNILSTGKVSVDRLSSQRVASKACNSSSLLIDELLELGHLSEIDETGSDATDEESSFKNSDVDTVGPRKEQTKWEKIPIGTFRRSRRISAPLLKLSRAVKSTFGVVPHSIHETLLGCGSADSVVLPEALVYLPSKSQSSRRNAKSVVVGPPSHEMGMGSFVEKKLSDKKERIMKAVRIREKKLNDIFDSMKKKEHTAESVKSDESVCSCSDCDCDGAEPVHQVANSKGNALCFDDLSSLIHDPSHPPSACASPDNLFAGSPNLFAVQTSAEIDRMDLGPSEIDDGAMHVEQAESYVLPSYQSRRKRKTSVFNAGGMKILNIDNMLKCMK